MLNMYHRQAGSAQKTNSDVDDDMHKGASVMVVDDDRAAAKLIGDYLAQHHFRVSYEYDGNRVVHRVILEQPDLLILDLLLPGADGLSICRELRAQYPNPIIILSGLDEDADIVSGLELGATAYLTKPIKPRVLLAYVRSQLRHQSFKQSQADDEPKIRCENLLIDLKKRAVYKNNQEVDLTNAEYDLLTFLARQRGTVVARNDIYKNLRKLEYNGIDRGIDLRISRLRKKLDDDPKCPRLIKTIRGIGYLFTG